jgi:hypothetical protein
MGMTKNYLLTLLQKCSEEQFGQDAIEWAVFNGHVQLTGNLADDVRLIMGSVPDGPPDETNYDCIIAAYRRSVSEHGAALLDLYHASGLMEEILRPIPLTMQSDLVER